MKRHRTYTIEIHNTVEGRRIPRQKISTIICVALKKEKVQFASVSVVVVNDSKIHSLNKEFLNHDYVTDVITFPLESDSVDGEIYISLDTARRQAKEYNVTTSVEVLRLAIHGTLHLLGYDDATQKERQQMHELENYYLKQV